MDGKAPVFIISQNLEMCGNSDICLYVQFESLADYSLLYYSNSTGSSNEVLRGHLKDSCYGVSLIGNVLSKSDYYVTFLSFRTQSNSHFYINSSGTAAKVKPSNVGNINMRLSDESTSEYTRFSLRQPKSDFETHYPLLPKRGYIIKASCFYDESFHKHHKERTEISIKRLFDNSKRIPHKAIFI